MSDKVKILKISEFSQKMIHFAILQFGDFLENGKSSKYDSPTLTINLKFFKIFNSLDVPDDHICHLLTGFPQNESQVQNSVNANFSNLNSTNQISSDSPNNLPNEK